MPHKAILSYNGRVHTISETARHSNFKIYHNVSQDSLYISTGNHVIICFRSAANRTNVSILGHVRLLIYGSIEFKKVYGFRKGDSRASSFVAWWLDIFRRNAIGVSRYWNRLRQYSFVRHEIISSNISKTVWPIITKFYEDTHTDIVISHTGYDVIIYFRSEVIGEKQSILYPPTVSGGNSRERLKVGSWNLTRLSRTSGFHKPARNGVTISFRSTAKCY